MESAFEGLDPDEWPRTVDEAVALLMTIVSEADREMIRALDQNELISLHHGFGTGVRNVFGLWGGNDDLLIASCGELCHPDDASVIIIETFWTELQ